MSTLRGDIDVGVYLTIFYVLVDNLKHRPVHSLASLLTYTRARQCLLILRSTRENHESYTTAGRGACQSSVIRIYSDNVISSINMDMPRLSCYHVENTRFFKAAI